MAECHPVAFRWVVQAKLKGAKLIHVDPRFTRTSAMADIHAAIRAGSDIAFLGGLVNHVINSERWNTDPFFKEFVVNYTNAATIINDEFKDTEDLDGVFSGLLEAGGGVKEWPYNAGIGRYDNKSWQYAGGEVKPGPTFPIAPAPAKPAAGAAAAARGRPAAAPKPAAGAPAAKTRRPPRPPRAPLLPLRPRRSSKGSCAHSSSPRRRGMRRSRTRAASSRSSSGTSPATRRRWSSGPPAAPGTCSSRSRTPSSPTPAATARRRSPTPSPGRSTPTACRSSAPAPCSSSCSATWAGPGGGVMALRGHASIQGSTDLPTLYHSIHGYMAHPTALRKHDTLEDWLTAETPARSYWANTPKFMVSYLKSMYGEAATRDNDFGYEWHPRIIGDHSHMANVRGHGRRPGEGHALHRPEPGHLAPREPRAPGARQARLAGGQGQLADRDRHLLEERSRGEERPGQAAGHQDRGVLLPLGADRRVRGDLHQHPAHAPVAPQGGGPARRLPLRHLVHPPARPSASRSSTRTAPCPATRASSTSPGTSIPSRARTTRGTPPASRRAQDHAGDQRLPDRAIRTATSPASASSRTTGRPPAPRGSTAGCSPRRTRTWPTGARPIPRASRGPSSPGAGPGPRTGACSTTAPPPTQGAAVERAEEVGLVGRREVDGLRRARLRGAPRPRMPRPSPTASASTACPAPTPSS